jgi:hypothetical protein
MKSIEPIYSSYLEEVMDIKNLPQVVTSLADAIRRRKLDFNAIAFRGMSGALVTPMLCRRLKKGMIVCRKDSEQSHGKPVEGYLVGGNYIIVDDFIGSGHTVKEIVKAIEKWWTTHTSPSACPPLTIPCFKPLAVFIYTRGDCMKYIRLDDDRDEVVPVYGTEKPNKTK